MLIWQRAIQSLLGAPYVSARVFKRFCVHHARHRHLMRGHTELGAIVIVASMPRDNAVQQRLLCTPWDCDHAGREAGAIIVELIKNATPI